MSWSLKQSVGKPDSGILGGNMTAVGSVNKKFKTQLLKYDIMGTTLKKGDLVYELIGIRSGNFDIIKVKAD